MNQLAYTPAARLGNCHGYRFEGDVVYLNAEVCFDPFSNLPPGALVLQLWAAPATDDGGPLQGDKVAEVTVFQPWDGSSISFTEASALALLPAGSHAHTLGLALVARQADGQEEVLDLSTYDYQESFNQPRLDGIVNCELSDGCATLAVDSLTNPRGVDNLSGTLALELWALNAPYQNSQWQGSPVASVVLGELSGQCHWSWINYQVPAASPAPSSHLVLMLREWTPAGYVTRDYRNLYQVAAAPVLAAAIEATAPEAAPPVKDSAPTVAAPAAPKADDEKAAPRPVNQADKTKQAKALAPVASAPATTKADSKKTGPVSINKASEAELVALNGIGPAMAKAIIAARPYAALSDLKKVKGMGAKLLNKLTPRLGL